MLISELMMIYHYLLGMESRENIENLIKKFSEKDKNIIKHYLDDMESWKILTTPNAIGAYETGILFKKNQEKGRKRYTIIEHYVNKILALKEGRKKYSDKIKEYYKEIQDVYSLTSAWRFKKELEKRSIKFPK